MRLVGTFKDPQLGKRFSLFLHGRGISNQFDSEGNGDWGSDDYGTATSRVWVIDEEHYEEASRHYETFCKNPFDQSLLSTVTVSAPPPPPSDALQKKDVIRGRENVGASPPPLGRVTTAILALCILLFLIGVATTPSIRALPENLPYTPFVTPTVEKELLYDYPEAYEYIDRAIKLYGVEALNTPGQLPPEGQYLLQKYYTTPYWQGLYPDIVNYFRDLPSSQNREAPLFEKIGKGEVWRLFTPALLHFDIFHILFNMLWLVVLGRQMERSLGVFRYILFILVVAIASNTAQYLMGGANFIGYSGVICGMIVFIWKRQQLAPWEGYLLERSTVLFVAFFVFAVMGVQLLSFVLEVYGSRGFVAGIANTAHISGGIAGYLLARLPFFAWKN